MTIVTYDSLPNSVGEILQKLDLLLSQTQVNQNHEDPHRLLNIEQLIDYLPEHPAKQTVYGWINQRCTPFEKHGRRLYFRKSEIDSWLANGRRIK